MMKKMIRTLTVILVSALGVVMPIQSNAVNCFAKGNEAVSLMSCEVEKTNDYIRTSLENMPGLTKSNYGTEYDPAAVITNRSYSMYSGVGKQTYLLDGDFTRLTGTIYVPEESRGVENKSGIVQIYGDDILLYEMLGMSGKDKAVDFDINIYSAERLTVRIYGGWYRGDGTGLIPMNCVTNLELRKDGDDSMTWEEFSKDQPIYLSNLEYWSKDRLFDTYTFNNELIEDNFGNVYSADRVFNAETGGDEATIEYFLDGKYTELSGTMYVPKTNRGVDSIAFNAHFAVYGDGELLYTSDGLTGKERPLDFTVDITGVEFLEIRLAGKQGKGDGVYEPFNCVANLAVR
ncbi:MAG: NPCBM/NEW2 domain-containing protein [Lachnospiraceae bacterium]|nr:NPCBM/NEW2 domain-containing protein [Lachnospiraceae bacterium]